MMLHDLYKLNEASLFQENPNCRKETGGGATFIKAVPPLPGTVPEASRQQERKYLIFYMSVENGN